MLFEARKSSPRQDTWAMDTVDYYIRQALKVGASDIHLEPHAGETSIRYRVDGELLPAGTVPSSRAVSLVNRVKVLAGMSIVDSLNPQDGHMVYRSDDGDVNIRISTLPTVYGERVVMRVLDGRSMLLDLDSIGFEAHQIEVFRRTIHLPHGLILIAGPTGSGKTTTLYSTILDLNLSKLSVVTFEDPVEHYIGGISQLQVNPRAGLTFSSGIRACLRQDPDVIAIGEIRDMETAGAAVTAALAGRLVVACIHGSSSGSVLRRMLNMGADSEDLASVLVAIVCQRLVRTVCPHCSVTGKVTDDEAGLYRRFDLQPPDAIVRSHGCPQCGHTGYLGRRAVFSVYQLGDTDLTVSSRTQWHDAELMRSALRAAGRKETTIEEICRVLGAPH